MVIWLSLAALVLGLSLGACGAAKIAKARYRSQLNKGLARQRAEFERQLGKMQKILEAKAQNIQAVESAQSVEEVTDALDSIYSGFGPGA